MSRSRLSCPRRSGNQSLPDQGHRPRGVIERFLPSQRGVGQRTAAGVRELQAHQAVGQRPSVAMGAGRLAAILDASGSGKSALMHMLPGGMRGQSATVSLTTSSLTFHSRAAVAAS